MAAYISDHTKFIREFLSKHPEEVEEQRKGRAMWWDKPQDVKALQERQASMIPQKPYYYQTDV